MNSKPLHFKGLNGIRAIAALAVVISHTTQGLLLFNLYPYIFGKNQNGGPIGLDLAGFGVSIFFALSGFLITFLLLLEKEKGEINIKKFYIRRILRIWPLYYFYLFIAVCVIIIIGEVFNAYSFLLYFFYAANIPLLIGYTLPFLAHYWSLGVEEQFYMFWPWIVKLSNKKLFIIVLVMTLLLIGLKLFFRFSIPNGDQSLLYRLIHITRFHCMLIGATGAILYFNKNLIFIKIFTHKTAQIFAWGIMLLIAINRFHIASVLDNEFVSIVALVIILGQITVKNRLINLEGRVFDFLGKISYGIYVIHPLIIFTLSLVIKNIQINDFIKYFITYVSVIGLTIFASYISYEFLEKRFLKIKHKYSIIKTSASRQEL